MGIVVAASLPASRFHNLLSLSDIDRVAGFCRLAPRPCHFKQNCKIFRWVLSSRTTLTFERGILTLKRTILTLGRTISTMEQMFFTLEQEILTLKRTILALEWII